MFENLKRYWSWIFLGTVLLIIHKLIENYKNVFSQASRLFNVMTPFIWGFIITYFLLGFMRLLERKFKLKRGWSFALSYVMFFGAMILFGLMVAPVIVQNITDIIELAPQYVAKMQALADRVVHEVELLDNLHVEEYFNKYAANLSTWAVDFLNTMLNSLVSGIIGVTSWIFKFVFGIIISMYILFDVENFEKSGKRFILASLGEPRATEFLNFLEMSDQIFKDYFVGKVIDSAIVGLLCYIGLALIGAPYVMLLSLLVGIFNMIPYVGPVIGAVPAVLITFLVSPSKALWVAIFIMVLQQIDGNIIGPKVLSDKVGVSPFGVVLAIAIGGGYFGIIGMLVSVPIYKVVSILVSNALDRKIISRKSEQKVLKN